MTGPTRSRWLLAALVAAAGIALPFSSARAEPERQRDRRRVLLLVDTPGDPFLARIGAEIASLGLEVVARAPQGPIETSARSEHAVAAVRMLPSRNGVEVWMADETSGRSLLRQAIVDETPGGPNQNLIALQTAELLRTSFFPRRPPDTAPPTPAPPVVVQLAPPAASRESGIAGSIGLLYGAGGAGPAWQASLSFQQLLSDRLGIGFHVSAPLHRGTMSGPEGTAEVGAILAAAEALARLDSESPRLFLTAGLGAGFAAVLAKGTPSPSGSAQFVSNDSVAYTGLGYARVAVGWKPAHWLAVGASGLAGTTPGRVQVRFAGNDTGTWGMPVLGATLFAQLYWR